MKTLPNQNGFSLFEFIIVLAIIAVVLALVGWLFFSVIVSIAALATYGVIAGVLALIFFFVSKKWAVVIAAVLFFVLVFTPDGRKYNACLDSPNGGITTCAEQL